MRGDPNNPGYLSERDDEPSAPPTELELSQARQLNECWDLLLDLIDLPRPLAGGFQARAYALLVRHGVIDPGEAAPPPPPPEKAAGEHTPGSGV